VQVNPVSRLASRSTLDAGQTFATARGGTARYGAGTVAALLE